MNTHDYSKHFITSSRVAVALCALVALGSQAAQAQTILLDQNGTATQLGAGTVVTDFAPLVAKATVAGFLPSPETVNAGPTNKVTFTAQGEPTSNTGFELPISNGLSTNFAPGTILINTFDGVSLNPTGPLQLDFLQGVTGFGINAQDDSSDSETFHFNVFLNGSTTSLAANQFTLMAVDNHAIFDSSGNIISGGKSVFLGALATGNNVITRVDISSSSLAAGGYTGASNDFIVGPATLKPFAPVPEASTAISGSMGLVLFTGLIFSARKRKSGRTPQAAIQTAD